MPLPLYFNPDDDDDPVQLPNGLLVCASHGLEVCGICCVDYSFMRDVIDSEGEDLDVDEDEAGDDDEDDEIYYPMTSEMRARVDAMFGYPQPRRRSTDAISESDSVELGSGFPKRRGTGLAFPSKFKPPAPTSLPTDVFYESPSEIYTRFIHGRDPGKFLIYTDGACLNNGGADPRAGWAFVFGPETEMRTCKGRLELKGPFGDHAKQTSNRAELRGAIAAMRARHWVGEGYHTLVIATDSEYVVKGATEWARTWIWGGWRTSNGKPVQNKDLWELLLGEVERCRDFLLEIEMWRIPRGANAHADEAAKKGAEGDDIEEFQDMVILGI